MRNSPLFMAALYFLLGCIFTHLAIRNVTDTIWNMWTILFAVMATIDFNLALRLILVKFTKKNNNKTQRSLPLRFIVDNSSKSKLMFVTLLLNQYDEFLYCLTHLIVLV